jgi:multidrug efflux pump subunit AcrB
MKCTNNKQKKKEKISPKKKKEGISINMKAHRINRKGSAFYFIYAMAFLFVLTILYIIFGQVLKVYIYPTTVQLTGGDMTQPTKWLSFWNFTPYIIILIIGLFLFFKLTQRDTTEGQ